jgi:hypothetical protein
MGIPFPPCAMPAFIPILQSTVNMTVSRMFQGIFALMA